MRALVVHAHSEADSFVTAMKDVIVAQLQADGLKVRISDLYAKQFNPVASPADFSSRQNSEHLVYALEQRHGYECGTLAPDILAELDMVLEADLLIFTFPVYWFGAPAILKGWFDRIMLSGVCYGGKRLYGKGGLTGKRSFVAMSLGGREHMFGSSGLHGELATGMMRHLFQGTLGYVGTTVLEPFVAYHAPYISDAARVALLDDLREAVSRLESRSCLPLPDLARFDEKLAPLRA